MQIYTDGSCIGAAKRRYAGYGVHFAEPGICGPDISVGFEDDATNQRAELWAILAALQRLDNRHVPLDVACTINTDSQYSIDCLTKWRLTWSRNEWKTSKGADVKHADLVRAAGKLYDRRQPALRLAWVKGHSDCAGNVIADRLATSAADTISKSLR